MNLSRLSWEALKVGQLIAWTVQSVWTETCSPELIDDVGVIVDVDKRSDECIILWFRKPEEEGQNEIFLAEWFDDNEGRIFSLQ